MKKMNIKTKQLSEHRIQIVGIENVLTRKELPREYTEHVPYMYWTDPFTDQYLFINWMGGLDHVCIGDVYTDNEFQRINEHIDECKSKLRDINRAREEKKPTALDIKLGEWAGVVHFNLLFTKSLDACFE